MDMFEFINSIGKNSTPIEALIDADWVNAFNRTLGEHTLNWANGISTPKVSQSEFQRFYGLSNQENDALHVAPLGWGLTLKEPQTTGALVKFMSHPSTSIRYNRVVSFLSALHCVAEKPEKDEIISVFSEFPTKDGRIDILIAWGKGSGDVKFSNAVIVEVKQGALLSDDQLLKYETAAPQIASTVQFAFLCKSFSTEDIKQIGASEVNWVCSQWWAFLRRMENNIYAQADDFEFRQFRSTLWEQLA